MQNLRKLFKIDIGIDRDGRRKMEGISSKVCQLIIPV